LKGVLKIRPDVLASALQPLLAPLDDEQVVGLNVYLEGKIGPGIVDGSFTVLTAVDLADSEVRIWIKDWKLDTVVV
jgi:hypothetical protein